MTQIGVTCQETYNMAASENISSLSVYRELLSALFVQTVLHEDMQWETNSKDSIHL